MEEFTIASSFAALFSATVVMVVMATYTANLASYFSSQTVYSGIQGFQDIGYWHGQWSIQRWLKTWSLADA